MSIHEIIDNIKYKELINNNYFFGNYGDYLRCGNSYIKLLSEAFPSHSDITDNSIIIYINNDNNNDNNNNNNNDNNNNNNNDNNNDKKKYKINYIIKSHEVHWTISRI